MDKEDLLTVEQARIEAGYKHRSTLYRAIGTNRLEALHIGNVVLVTRDALKAFLANRGKRRPGAGRKKKEATDG